MIHTAGFGFLTVMLAARTATAARSRLGELLAQSMEDPGRMEVGMLLGAAVLILAQVAIVGAAIWWYLRSQQTTPEETTPPSSERTASTT